MAGVALVAGVAACGRGDGERRINSVQEPTPGTLVAHVDACRSADHLPFTVRETATSVTVTVREIDVSRTGTDDCSSSVTVRLGEPVGTRRLIDGSSGATVPLTR